MINYILRTIKKITYTFLSLLSVSFIIYMLLVGIQNISLSKKFKLKSEYYQEDEYSNQQGVSLMDPLQHSSSILNQNNIGIDVSKYILEAIAFSPHGTYCLINKKILSIGDILDNENNIKILEIRDDSIEIGNHNFRHIISMHN